MDANATYYSLKYSLRSPRLVHKASAGIAASDDTREPKLVHAQVQLQPGVTANLAEEVARHQHVTHAAY